MAQTVPQPVPTPPDFPVTWRSPDEQRMFWTLDRMHFPAALAPLEIDFLGLFHEFGFNPIAAAYDIPMRLLSKPMNSYYYQAAMPPTFDPDELAAMGRRSQEKLGAQMARLDELWNQEVLPEVKQHLAYFEEFDLAGASLPDLLAHYDGAVERMQRLSALHFRTVFPVYITISQFDELYREVLGNESAFDAYALLQGFENRTTETGQALWALSRRALALPGVRQILEERAARLRNAAPRPTPGQPDVALRGEVLGSARTGADRARRFQGRGWLAGGRSGDRAHRPLVARWRTN